MSVTLHTIDVRADELLMTLTPLETMYVLRREFPAIEPSVLSERIIASKIANARSRNA